MPSSAVSGVGTEFKRGDGASVEAFVVVAEVNNIDGPTMVRDFIDVTSLDSTGGYREFIGGFRDGGEVSLGMNFTISGYSDMLADFQSDTSRNFQIVLPDTGNSTLDFAAFVTNLPLSIVPDDKVTVAVTMKITGQPTLTT